MGLLPSFAGEGAVYGRQIAARQPTARIAVLYENDEYCAELLAGLKRGLGPHAKQIVGTQSYVPTDLTVTAQVTQLKSSGADIFVIFALPTQAIQAFVAAVRLGWKPVEHVTSVSIDPAVMQIVHANAGTQTGAGATSTAFPEGRVLVHRRLRQGEAPRLPGEGIGRRARDRLHLAASRRAGRVRRSDTVAVDGEEHRGDGQAVVRIGTCSWADEALSKYFYPPKLPARERLAWYAEHFDTVEVDSTYYRLPDAAIVEGWAARTPPGFVMHVKAFGLMTRHPVKADVLPEDLRAEMPIDDRGRVDRPPRELRGEVFRRFLGALEPLRAAGKLGGILFQLPSYVVFKERSLDYLEWARERLGDHEMLVEFRHRSWLDDENRVETFAFLERIGAAYVTVDAPRSESAKNLIPTVPAVTSSTAYVRFHGRNLGTWNKRGGSAAERFDYLYAEEELAEWVPTLHELAGQSEQAFAFFNNNASSGDPENPLGRVSQAATNAFMLRKLLA
jgi:uncharacterized protein YecE (DUF72 family)